MGIQGLLPLLKSIEKPVHLKDYAGQTLAVDGYVWLHKGAFSCAQELCLGQPTQKYITYFMRKIDMFKFFGVKPYVVFDGGYLPSKAATEQERLSRREESKKAAMELLHSGKSKQAQDHFRKCVDVTPEMAYAVIQALEAAQVDFVVAPYEADAQMAYLEMKGLVHGIVTEDSDLLVFGCKRVIFKLDQYGSGIEILHENLSMVRDISFHEWTMTEIRHMCILAGCDYLPSIPGMGLKTAQRVLRRFKTFERAIKHLRMEYTGAKIKADYEEAFRKADLTFLYARVYDPVSHSMVHLNAVPEELEELVQTDEYDFLGPILDKDIVQGIATGKIHPMDKTTLSCPTTQRPILRAVHGSEGKENRQQYTHNLPRQTLPSTKSIHAYFTKTAVSSSSSTETGETVKKVGTHKDSETVIKQRPLEFTSAPAPAFPTTNTASAVLQEHPATTENTSCLVIVEARSRFFGFESSTADTATDTVDCKTIRSYTVREDSGIGLDESALLHTSDNKRSLYEQSFFGLEKKSKRTSLSKSASLPLLSKTLHAEATSLPRAANTTLLDDALDCRRAEAKVIQGWREKFSNSSGSAAGRAPGLTRAFQASGIKIKGTTVSVSQSVGSKQHLFRPIKAVRTPAGHHTQQVSIKNMEIVRTTPGLPVYHLDTTRRSTTIANRTTSRAVSVVPPTNRRTSGSTSTSSGSGTHSLSQAAEDVGGPMLLNLDCFKYTPVGASQIAPPAKSLP